MALQLYNWSHFMPRYWNIRTCYCCIRRLHPRLWLSVFLGVIKGEKNESAKDNCQCVQVWQNWVCSQWCFWVLLSTQADLIVLLDVVHVWRKMSWNTLLRGGYCICVFNNRKCIYFIFIFILFEEDNALPSMFHCEPEPDRIPQSSGLMLRTIKKNTEKGHQGDSIQKRDTGEIKYVKGSCKDIYQEAVRRFWSTFLISG